MVLLSCSDNVDLISFFCWGYSVALVWSIPCWFVFFRVGVFEGLFYLECNKMWNGRVEFEITGVK